MIYLDNSATTKPFPEVLNSFMKVSSDYFGNPSSLHNFGGKAEQLLRQARQQVANILSVKPNELIFTSGGTEGNNLAIKGAAYANSKKGRHLITTNIEHASVREVFHSLKEDGFTITIIEADHDGKVNPEDIKNAMRNDTILVSVMHVNNEVGTIQPIEEIGNMIKKYQNALFHVDYVQGVGKVPLDFEQCHIDLCTMSGHKFHGLKGTGLLFAKEGIKINPLFNGGNQEATFRSGTENVAGAVSLAKALRMTMEKFQYEKNHLQSLSDELRKGLASIQGVLINTPEIDSAPHIMNFSIPPIKSEVFVHALEEKEIYVSTTSACSSKQKTNSSTLMAMGVTKERANSAIRVSLSYWNTMEEIKMALDAIEETIDALRKVMK
ncbi:cysteine desulfurase family protein [Niallia sp. Krafla_26]|uniref:cysteine desulfurase family protein n=1 Tax=Niallia sp. Krafla_26 TaxID=3064703 RepID=UPI003D16DAE9